MNQVSERRRYNIALEMGVLYALIILVTIIRRIPALLTMLQTPDSQSLNNSGLWFTLGEMLFISAGLVAMYGLISLWLADLRFILSLGMGLVVVAGLVYLMAAVTYYQTRGIGPAIQRGGSMFLLSLAIPILAGKLFGRAKRV
jgi:hypothetical protein